MFLVSCLLRPALSTTRYDSAKEDLDDPTKGLFRRRGRPSMLHEGGGKGTGGSGGKTQDGVELTLLSESSGDGGAGGAIGGGGRRDTTSPPPGGQQATFYL